MGQSRNEDALENILGAQNELLPPMSRNEKWLHAILGEEIETEEPQSRIEELLKQIYDEGMGDNRFELTYKSQEFKVGDIIDDETLKEEIVSYYCERMLLLVASVNGNEYFRQANPLMEFIVPIDDRTSSLIWTETIGRLQIDGETYIPKSRFTAYWNHDKEITGIQISERISYTNQEQKNLIEQGVTFHFEGYTNKFNQ